MTDQKYTLGIDIGSTTVKYVLCDEAFQIYAKAYTAHDTRQAATLLRLLEELSAEHPALYNNIEKVYITGSGATYGISVVQKGYTGIVVSGSTREVDFSSNVLIFSAATKLSVIPRLKTSRINKLADSLGVGANLKILLGQSFRRTGELDRSATGWEADLGLYFKPQRWLSFGATLNNCIGAGWAGSGGFPAKRRPPAR